MIIIAHQTFSFIFHFWHVWDHQPSVLSEKAFDDLLVGRERERGIIGGVIVRFEVKHLKQKPKKEKKNQKQKNQIIKSINKIVKNWRKVKPSPFWLE